MFILVLLITLLPYTYIYINFSYDTAIPFLNEVRLFMS